MNANNIGNQHTDSIQSSKWKKRKWLIGGLSVAGYGGSLIALNEAWYKQYPKTSFHVFNDAGEWLQMDKTGHAWAAYNTSRATTAMWQWAGLTEKKAVLTGSISGFAYLTVIELLDAHSEKWGWSWADIGANATGSALFAVQQLTWKMQRIQFKFSAHKKEYAPALQNRANELFGNSLPERMLKDYNSQTYWLSFNLRSFLPESNLPPWLNISAGYGADGMYGGYENIGLDKNGAVIFSRPDIKRVRQWYLSPDIDLTKIKTKSKTLRTVLATLNTIKIPAPALLLSDGKLKGKWVHF